VHLFKPSERDREREEDVGMVDLWWEGWGRIGRKEQREGGVEVGEGEGELGLPEGVGEGFGRLRGIIWSRRWIG